MFYQRVWRDWYLLQAWMWDSGFVEKVDKMRIAETLLVGLDEGAVGAVLRAAIGFATTPAVAAVMGQSAGDWALGPGVAVIVILLRLVPLVIRKLVPFSRRAQEIWWNRRQMAKRYDSYQWQKLFWMGMGIALYSAVAGALRVPNIVVSATCIAAGGVGLARWRAVARRGRGGAALSEATRGTA
jgi:hypothetical protein